MSARMKGQKQQELDMQNAENKKKSANFREHIRNFNSSLATAGLQADLDHLDNSRGPYCFRIHGQVGRQIFL